MHILVRVCGVAILLCRWSIGEGQTSARSCREGFLGTTNEVLAYHYAPVLSFAGGEHYFPTVPFFPAFDAVERSIPPPPNFLDLDRVATPDSWGRISWD